MVQVKAEVYNVIGREDSPNDAGSSQDKPSTRESRVLSRTAVRVEEEVERRMQSVEEIKLQAEYLKLQRKMESLGEQLLRLQKHNNDEARVRLSTAGVCASLETQPPPKKKMRTNGHGREEAVVLNSIEQLQAARARQDLKQQEGDMKTVIKEANRKNRAADKKLKEEIKKHEKLMFEIDKALAKATNAKRKAAACIPIGDKKQALVAATTIGKAMEKAQTSLENGRHVVRLARLHLVEAQKCRDEVKNKELELQVMREAAQAVAMEDDEEPELDDDEEGALEEPDDSSLSPLADVEARLKEATEATNECLTLADQAVVSALVAVATSVLVKAMRKEQKQALAAANRATARSRAAAPLQDITNIA